jgi:hypothetical protein
VIKATGRAGDGRPLLVLGLSGENVTRLTAGEPMSLDLRDVGMRLHVLVVYGRTEDDIAGDLKTHLGAVGG